MAYLYYNISGYGWAGTRDLLNITLIYFALVDQCNGKPPNVEVSQLPKRQMRLRQWILSTCATSKCW
jgi:hypothetical protein